MTLEHIRSLYAYNRWANARFFEVLATLDPSQLTLRLESSFPTILATLAHLIGAEWIWLRRWKGESPTEAPRFVAEPELPGLHAKLAEIDAERDRLLAALDEEDLAAPLSYRTMDGTPYRDRLGDLLVHVVNHSTYHRGQLTTLLRQVGATPPATDFVVFVRDTESGG